MKKMLICFSLLVFGSAFAENYAPLSIGEIAVMQQNQNGTYEVVCANGNRETVTDLDLQLNNVCPNLKSSKPSGILSLQKRQDGNFDVVCRDLKKTVASEEEVLSGDVCKQSPPPAPTLEDGRYEDTDRYFCDQEGKFSFSGNTILTASIKFVGGCSGGVEMTCTGTVCKGSTNGYTYSLEPKDQNQYLFNSVSSNRSGLFKLKE